MKKTPSPSWGTSRFCIVTLKHDDPDGFYNTEHTATGHDPHIWISATGARLLAEAEGYVHRNDVEALKDDIARLENLLEDAVQEISGHRKYREQIDGLAAAGFEVRKTGGRPSKRTDPEVIKSELAGRAG
jgi:hypothetical protein